MLGIIGAMSEEVNIIKDEMQFSYEEIIGKFTFYIGSLRDRKIVLAESGIGKVNAGMLATIMIIKFNVKAVCFSGVAGALDSRLKVGDVVIGEKMIKHDMDVREFGLKKGEIPRMDTSVFMSNNRLMEIVNEYKLPNNKTYTGTIISGDQFISSKQAKEGLAKEFKVPLLTRIPINEKMCKSCDTGKMDELFSDPAIKSAFVELTDSIL